MLVRIIKVFSNCPADMQTNRSVIALEIKDDHLVSRATFFRVDTDTEIVHCILRCCGDKLRLGRNQARDNDFALKGECLSEQV